MLESILVYTLTAVMLYALAKCSASNQCLVVNRGKQPLSYPFWDSFTVISILFFAFIAGARYNVGVDHLSYLGDYQNMLEGKSYALNIDKWLKEPGFFLILKLFSGFQFHYFFYFAFWGALQIGFVYYALRDKRYLIPYVALAIMLGPTFLSWMNGIRQCVVSCAFIFFVEFIADRKFWKYCIGILLMATIHKSAVLLLPVYFCFKKDIIWDKKYLLIGILFICVIIGSTPTWLGVMNNVSGVLQFLGYDAYAEHMSDMTTDSVRSVSWGPSRLSIFLISILIIWFYDKMVVFFKGDKRLHIYFILFYLGACLYNLFVNTSHIFLRPVEYLTAFRLIMLAYLLFYLKKTKRRYFFYGTAILAFTHVYFTVFKAVYTMSDKLMAEKYLYEFFFQVN